MIKYLYAKLLYLFGLASNNPKLAEAVWSQVQATVQYSAVQYSTAQYSTVQYSTEEYSAVQCSKGRSARLRIQ